MKKLFTICATFLFLLAAGATKASAASDRISVSTYESGDQLTAVIKAENFSQPVLGLAFDLLYDPEILAYEGYEEGAFLEVGGEPIYLVTNVIDHLGGHVITGMTLKRADQPVDSGGTIITFDFDILVGGKTTLAFENMVVSKLNEEGKREDVESIDWTGQSIKLKISDEEESQPSAIAKVATGSVEDTEQILGQANVLDIEGAYIPGIIIISLSLLLLICYIAWRLYKKRNAFEETTYSGVPKPSQTTVVTGDRSEF